MKGILFSFLLLMTAPIFGFEQRKETARDFKHAYIALAGPGTGVSIMGHAFIVFTKKPNQYMAGYAFQYNLFPERPPEIVNNQTKEELERELENAKTFVGRAKNFVGYLKDGWNEPKADGLLNAPFKVEKEMASIFMARYQLEGRPTFLFELNLTDAERIKLYKNLEKDKKDRDENIQRDYGILANNCLTKAIDAVNAVVTKERYIANYWTDGILSLDTIGNINSFKTNIPLVLVNTLKGHKVVKGKYDVVQPNAAALIKIGIVLRNLVDDFHKQCKMPKKLDNLKSAIRTVIVKPEIRDLHSFLKKLMEYGNACKDRKVKEDVFETITAIIYTDSMSRGKQEVVEEYIF